MDKNDDYKIGTFLIQNEIITQQQLNDALDMQKDNRDRLLGEILVTMGILTKEDIIMALEMYMMMSDSDEICIDEWLDQDEIDMLINKINPS